MADQDYYARMYSPEEDSRVLHRDMSNKPNMPVVSKCRSNSARNLGGIESRSSAISSMSWRGSVQYEASITVDVDRDYRVQIELIGDQLKVIDRNSEAKDFEYTLEYAEQMHIIAASISRQDELFFIELSEYMQLHGVLSQSNQRDKKAIVSLRISSTCHDESIHVPVLLPRPDISILVAAAAHLHGEISKEKYKYGIWSFTASELRRLWTTAPVVDFQHLSVTSGNPCKWYPGVHQSDAWTAALGLGLDLRLFDTHETTKNDIHLNHRPGLKSIATALSRRSGGLGALLRGDLTIALDLLGAETPDACYALATKIFDKDGLEISFGSGIQSARYYSPNFIAALIRHAGLAFTEEASSFCQQNGGLLFLVLGTRIDDAHNDCDDHCEPEKSSKPVILIPLSISTDDTTRPGTKMVLRARAAAFVNPLDTGATELHTPSICAEAFIVSIDTLSPEDMLLMAALQCSDNALCDLLLSEEASPMHDPMPSHTVVPTVASFLDATQKQFVSAAVNNRTNILHLAGAPGSGKTMTLAHAIAARLIDGCSTAVLVVAPALETLKCMVEILVQLGLPYQSTLILPAAAANDNDVLLRIAQNVNAARLSAPGSNKTPLVDVHHDCPNEVEDSKELQERIHALEDHATKIFAKANQSLRSFATFSEVRRAAVNRLAGTSSFASVRAFAANGARPELKNGENGMALTYKALEGWTDLVVSTVPVILATPKALVRWLPDDAHIFDTIVLDDADLLSKCDALVALSKSRQGLKAQSETTALVAALDAPPPLRRGTAWKATQKLATFAPVKLGRLYTGSALPFAASEHSSECILTRSGDWPLKRLGGTLAAVADALATCRRESKLPANVVDSTCYGGERAVSEAYRALRGARICCGEAASMLSDLRTAANELRLLSRRRRRFSVIILCRDATHARLFRVLVAAELIQETEVALTFGRVDVRDFRSIEYGGIGAIDIALISIPRSKAVSTERMTSLVLTASRFKSYVYTQSTEPCKERIDLFVSDKYPPAWVTRLHDKACTLSAPVKKTSRLLPLLWNGRSIWTIKNHDCIVLCHDAGSCGDIEILTELAVALPTALRSCFGWRRVLHLCEPVDCGNEEELGGALIADLCSWRQAFSLALCSYKNSTLSVRVAVDRPVPLRILQCLNVEVEQQLVPWRRRQGRPATWRLNNKTILDDSIEDTEKERHLDFEGHGSMAGLDCVLRLFEGTAKELLTQRCISIESAIPYAPSVARIELTATFVCIFIRARGKRARPWNSAEISYHGRIELTNESLTISNTSCECSGFDEKKYVALSLPISQRYACQSLRAYVSAKNSSGTSEERMISNAMHLPKNASAPQETIEEMTNRVYEELDIDEVILDINDNDDVAENSAEDRAVYYEDADDFDLEGGLENFGEDADHTRSLVLRLDSDGSALVFKGILQSDTLEFQGKMFRSDSPEVDINRQSIAVHQLFDFSAPDGSATVLAQNLMAQLLPKKQSRSGNYIVELYVRYIETNDWTSSVCFPVHFEYHPCAQRRLVDACIADEEMSLSTSNILDALLLGSKLHVRAQFNVDENAFAEATDCDRKMEISAELLTVDGASLLLAVSTTAQSSSHVLNLELSAPTGDKRSWYCAAYRLSKVKAVQLKVDDEMIDIDISPLRKLTTKKESACLCHPIIKAAVEHMFMLETFHTTADVARSALKIGECCIRAEYAAIHLQEECDKQFLVDALLDDWSTSLMRSQQVGTPYSVHHKEGYYAPMRSTEIAAIALLIASSLLEDRLGPVMAYVAYLFSEKLSPLNCTLLLKDFISTSGPTWPRLCPLLLNDVRRTWAPEYDDWRPWLQLDNLVQSLAFALTKYDRIVAVTGSESIDGTTCPLFRFDVLPAHVMPKSGTSLACAFYSLEHDCVELVVPLCLQSASRTAWTLRRDGRPYFDPAHPSRSVLEAPCIDFEGQPRRKAIIFTVDWSKSADRNIIREDSNRRSNSVAYSTLFSEEQQSPSTTETSMKGDLAIVSLADSTQRRAIINCVIASQSFVLRGPPGTGKSSTIAAAALALAGVGKTVLVVGQEDAAVRVVADKVRALCGERSSTLVATGEEWLATRKPNQKETNRVAEEWRRLFDVSRLPPNSYARPFVTSSDDARWSLYRDSFSMTSLSECHRAEEGETSHLSASRQNAEISDWSEDLEEFVAVLHRGIKRDGQPREWRYICEICGEERASALTALRHVSKHKSSTSVLTSTINSTSKRSKTTKKATAAQRVVDRLDELRAWKKLTCPHALAMVPLDFAVASAALQRARLAAAELQECNELQRKSLESLRLADEAERVTLRLWSDDISQSCTPREIAARLVETTLHSEDDSLAIAFALEMIESNTHDKGTRTALLQLYNLAKALATRDSTHCEDNTDDSSLGRTATLATLERIRRNENLPLAARSALDELYAKTSPNVRSKFALALVAVSDLAFLFFRCSEVIENIATARSATESLIRVACNRRIVSLRAVKAQCDADMFQCLSDSYRDQSFSRLPPIICATPDSARKLKLLDKPGRFDAVFIDEASQMRTHDAIVLAAAARTSLVLAGDDQQLPPRSKKNDVCSTGRGLLDDVCDLGRLSLVPLEWHYRSGDPTLIKISNALFYNSRLVATACSPKSCGDPKGLTAVLIDGCMESDRGPPAGLINRSQASAIARDASRIIAEADNAQKPLSLGIITLNRPQRSLILNLLLADGDARLEIDPENTGALRRRLDNSRDASILALDASLFIESIDRIQGEEREIILFSTLLTPRDEIESQMHGESKKVLGKTETVDPWDALEEIDSAESSSDEEDYSQSVRRTRSRRHNPRHHVRHYSTLTHAHGHRLLNVGITRAIVTLRCYIHGNCPAPSPHDDRAGRRAFGWLVRALLGAESPCTCTSCQRLNDELANMKTRIEADSDIEHKSADASEKLIQSDPLTIKESIRAVEKNSDTAIFSYAVYSWLQSSRDLVVTPVESTSQRISIDWAVATATKERVAILCSSRDTVSDWLDLYDAFPNVLLQPKLGWDRFCRLETSDIFQWILEEDYSTSNKYERIQLALSAVRDGMKRFVDCVRESRKDEVAKDSTDFPHKKTHKNTLEWLLSESPAASYDTQQTLSVDTKSSIIKLSETSAQSIPPMRMPASKCSQHRDVKSEETKLIGHMQSANAAPSPKMSNVPIIIKREILTPVLATRNTLTRPRKSPEDIATDDDSIGSLDEFIVEENHECVEQSTYSYYLSTNLPEQEPPLHERYQGLNLKEQPDLGDESSKSADSADKYIGTPSRKTDGKSDLAVQDNNFHNHDPKPATSKNARRQIDPIEDDY